MKTFLYIIFVLALLVGFPQTVRADYEDGDIVPAAVIAPLMAWVEAQTGVRVPVLPRVVASRTRLTEIVSHMGRLAGRAKALYIGGQVVLDHRYFDPEDSTQMSLLVHELVHYAQSFKHSAAWSCAQSKEVEAYTLQNKWLEDQGHSPFVRASWISRMAACPATTSAVAVAQAD
ncbi:MAG: DUF6647 family protein [Bdellovibrionales bacterium]